MFDFDIIETEAEVVSMNITKVSLGCCPKPKNNPSFLGANISKDAKKLFGKYIEAHPEEIDAFQKIATMDGVSIGIDNYRPHNIQYLVLRKEAVPNYRILVPLTSMKRISDCLDKLQ